MDMSKSAAEAPKSSSAPDGQQANFEETVSSRNTSRSAAPDRALLQKIPESPQNQTAGPQNKQDKQNTADADKSSQNCSKAPEHAKSPEKSKLMLKLKASPQKKAQQQGKLKKRRHSNQQQQGDGGPPKKKKAKGNRRSDPNFRMLPNKFLEGGSIDDPLNLRTVDDSTKSPLYQEEASKAPKSSLTKVTPGSLLDPLIPVFIPDDPRDPLGLNSRWQNENKKEKNKKRRHTVGDPIVSPAIEQRFDAQTEKDIMRVTKELQRRMHTRDVGREQKKKKQKNDNRNIDYSKLTEDEFNTAVSLMKFKSHKESRYGNYQTHFGNKLKFTDDRLNYLKKEWFQNKDVLDIGCNNGQFTLIVAKNLLPRKIVGIDIDKKLVETARRNIHQFIDSKLSETSSTGKSTAINPELPATFSKIYGPLEAPFVASGRGNRKAEFPENVHFHCGNYVPLNRIVLESQEPEYDVIMFMLVNKWIHMNHGDDGMKKTFHRMFKQLRPGGILIVEPHPWKSYTKIKKDCEIFFRNYYSIQLKPDKFAKYLCKQVGFREPKIITCPTAKGHSRQLLSFTKPQ